MQEESQAPQWIGLVARSTQLVPQVSSPESQPVVHTPSEHTVPVGQMVPQVPQLLPSELVCAQPDAHNALPLRHWQAPPVQICPTVHAAPQAPQCSALDCSATHAPKQSEYPLGQTSDGAPEPSSSFEHPPKITSTAATSSEHREAHTPQPCTRFPRSITVPSKQSKASADFALCHYHMQAP